MDDNVDNGISRLVTSVLQYKEKSIKKKKNLIKLIMPGINEPCT